MFNEALKLEDTISFTVGEPDFVTPKPIIDEACLCWEKGMTHYTPNSGVLELRKAIAEYHANDLKPDPETQIMVSCGATEAIQMALQEMQDARSKYRAASNERMQEARRKMEEEEQKQQQK